MYGIRDLVENVSYSAERLADANELMGSTFFDDHNDTQMALQYWRSAMLLRMANSTDSVPLPKRPVISKLETYKNAVEFSNMTELNAISLDLDAIRIQSLLICERILGPLHKDTIFRLMFRGASYADSLRYLNIRLIFRKHLIARNNMYSSFLDINSA